MQRTVTKTAQSKAKLLAQATVVHVTPPVAAAVELIVSLMSMQESPQPNTPDSHTALMRRCPACTGLYSTLCTSQGSCEVQLLKQDAAHLV